MGRLWKRKKKEIHSSDTEAPLKASHLVKTDGMEVVQFWRQDTGELVAVTSRVLKMEGRATGAGGRIGVGGIEAEGEYGNTKLWDINGYVNPKYLSTDGKLSDIAFDQMERVARNSGTILPENIEFKPLEEGKNPISESATLDLDRDGAVSISGTIIVTNIKSAISKEITDRYKVKGN